MIDYLNVTASFHDIDGVLEIWIIQKRGSKSITNEKLHEHGCWRQNFKGKILSNWIRKQISYHIIFIRIDNVNHKNEKIVLSRELLENDWNNEYFVFGGFRCHFGLQGTFSHQMNFVFLRYYWDHSFYRADTLSLRGLF